MLFFNQPAVWNVPDIMRLEAVGDSYYQMWDGWQENLALRHLCRSWEDYCKLITKKLKSVWSQNSKNSWLVNLNGNEISHFLNLKRSNVKLLFLFLGCFVFLPIRCISIYKPIPAIFLQLKKSYQLSFHCFNKETSELFFILFVTIFKPSAVILAIALNCCDSIHRKSFAQPLHLLLQVVAKGSSLDPAYSLCTTAQPKLFFKHLK